MDLTLCGKCGRRVVPPGEPIGIALLAVHDDMPCLCNAFGNNATVAVDIETQPLNYESAKAMLEAFEAAFPPVKLPIRQDFYFPFKHWTPTEMDAKYDSIIADYLMGRIPYTRLTKLTEEYLQPVKEPNAETIP